MLNTSSCDVGAFWFTRPLEWGKLHGYPLYQAISMMSGPTIFHSPRVEYHCPDSTRRAHSRGVLVLLLLPGNFGRVADQSGGFGRPSTRTPTNQTAQGGPPTNLGGTVANQFEARQGALF